MRGDSDAVHRTEAGKGHRLTTNARNHESGFAAHEAVPSTVMKK